jgi:phosphoribosyl 1,2-cyclic phosphodiesterase
MDNLRYGGNTSCVEIRTPGGELLIFDCGTGVRLLGKQLTNEFGHQGIQANILLSHYHWDHIQGIPFFEPLYNPENHFYFHSFPSQSHTVQQTLEDQMKEPYFPVNMSTMQAHRHFQNIGEEPFAFQDATIRTLPLFHPQGCLGFRVECGDHVLVYATDNEPGSPEHDRNVRTLAAGADVLIYDAQYTPFEYVNFKKGWGHSTWREGVNIAKECKVEQLVLFHHDPDHNDQFVDSALAEARKFFPNTIAAWEGLEIDMALDQHKKPSDRVERRGGTRHNVRVPLKVLGQRTDGSSFEEHTELENLSVHGAYFLLENEPDPRNPLHVEFKIPAEPVSILPVGSLKGQLVREEAVELPGKTKKGIAVAFR